MKAILDSLDSVDAALHDHYKEVDGKFVLQIDGVRDHPETQALKAALERVRKEKKDLVTEHEEAVARLEGLPDDFDADAYEALRAAADGKEPGKSDDRLVQVREQLERKHADAIGKKDTEIAKLRGTIERLTIDDGLSRAMDDANIDAKHKKKLAPYLKAIGKIKLEEGDDGFSAQVDTDMGPVSLAKFVSDWAGSDDGKEYVGKPKGLDTKGSDGRHVDVNPWAKDTANLTKQGEVVRADPGKARRMMAAAGLSEAQINQRLNAA
ncbi:hypothetical protein C7I85_11985 [Mesorhizobium soli]|uniref:Phage protein n=1 Tax=Pseudaminobacter soli (ex Li et al. 2025) TaxID=1295366 RepID=A0A2P7SEG7_9HYPH|nr:hypothetical protein C7I85_11985 [Mesorhizobium soli]